jgi:hypothetical protein
VSRGTVPWTELGRVGDGRAEARGVGAAAARDVERGAVVDARAHHREAQRDVHARLQAQDLDGSVALVEVHAVHLAGPEVDLRGAAQAPHAPPPTMACAREDLGVADDQRAAAVIEGSVGERLGDDLRADARSVAHRDRDDRTLHRSSPFPQRPRGTHGVSGEPKAPALVTASAERTRPAGRAAPRFDLGEQLEPAGVGDGPGYVSAREDETVDAPLQNRTGREVRQGGTDRGGRWRAACRGRGRRPVREGACARVGAGGDAQDDVAAARQRRVEGAPPARDLASAVAQELRVECDLAQPRLGDEAGKLDLGGACGAPRHHEHRPGGAASCWPCSRGARKPEDPGKMPGEPRRTHPLMMPTSLGIPRETSCSMEAFVAPA